jgi:hypothetical protein
MQEAMRLKYGGRMTYQRRAKEEKRREEDGREKAFI